MEAAREDDAQAHGHTTRSRPLPVSRAPHWRLQCVCGTVLSTCLCCPDRKDVHVEVWQDGCAWVAKWYARSDPVPGPLHAAAPPQDTQARSSRGRLAGHATTICAEVRAGVPLTVLAQRYGVTPSAISQVLRKHRVPPDKERKQARAVTSAT